MATAPPIVHFQNVSTNYDGLNDIVRDLDLEIAHGEFVTLMGPAGAGKTTILRMLAGFQTPTRGEIWLDGIPIHRTPPHRRGLGVVFPSAALFPHLSVAQNVAFPLTVRGVSRAARRKLVARMLDMLGLTGLEALRPAQLSLGQQQRVALARAVVFEPKLVLLDEPAEALDPAPRAEMLVELRRIHQSLGIAMLYVTQDLAAALMLSNRIVVLDHGVVQQVAPPAELYEAPANAFVAGFVGDNNALPGRIVAIDEDIAEIHLRAGPVVNARLGDASGPGDACVLYIRPERIALAAVEAIQMGAHALAAVVEEIIYQGDHVRVRLIIGAGAELIVKRPAAAGLAGIVVGRPAALAWQPAHARAFRP